MIPFVLKTPQEIAEELTERVTAERLRQNLSRSTLAKHAGVTESSLKRFETTGQISLERLLKLAWALGMLDAFEELFIPPAAESLQELEKRYQQKQRKRGRQ